MPGHRLKFLSSMGVFAVLQFGGWVASAHGYHPPMYTPMPLSMIPDPPTFTETFWEYLVLGFEHILPKGLDHILFVLGLFLLSQKWKPLVWQISMFTIAHTITLALSTNGIFSLPESIVEPLIALSIAFIAIENIFTSQLKPWRSVVIFVFGLLHGLGFAGVLAGLGIPSEQFTAALVAFNIGVEFGQLTVVGLAFLAVGYFRNRLWYRERVIVPTSLIIAAVGLFWTFERMFWS